MDNNFKSLPSGRPEKAFDEAYDAYKYLKDKKAVSYTHLTLPTKRIV